MTNNGLAALAAALHEIHAGPRPWPGGMTSADFAAAILGRGVFLPDGLPLPRWHHSSDAPPEHFCEDCDHQAATIATLRADVEREQAFVIAGQARENECEREIATLRAALDGLVEAVADPLSATYSRSVAIAAARAARATAKEAGG